VNPGAAFELTILGASREQAETLRELLEAGEPTSCRLPLVQRIIGWDVRCKEIEEYVEEFKPAFHESIERQVAESPEWATASELDKEDLISGFREKAVAELDVQPCCDVEVLLGENARDIEMDDSLIERYGVEAVFEYVSNFGRQRKVLMIGTNKPSRSAFEQLVSAGLAARGTDIPLRAVAEKLKLKDIQELVQDLDPPRFRKKAEAVNFLLACPDAEDRVGRAVDWQELFQLSPLPGEFAAIDLDRVSAYWRYARETANLLQHTYWMSAMSSRDNDEDFDRGWSVFPAPNACPMCKRAGEKRYPTGKRPATPLHVGCRCCVLVAERR